MPAFNNDQEIRIQCLQICGGSVAEAKNAYYWVMNEPNQAVKQQSGLQIGASSQQAQREQQVMHEVGRNAIAAKQGFDQFQQQNRNEIVSKLD